MNNTLEPKSILFSPVGDTDPIRNCYDGACLHIFRHYRPDMIVLFYTQDMKKKQEHDQRYTRALEHLDADIAIEEIFTDITEPHLFDSVIHEIPMRVYELHERYPNAEILMNLSSGTPAIKSTMAMVSVETDWCKAIQVSTPGRKSNRGNVAIRDDDDIALIMENNLDDEEDAVNRCMEAPLRIIKYYGDKHRILALNENYDYQASLNIARGNSDISPTAVKLIEHGFWRLRLMPAKARKVLSKYQGIQLAPFQESKERLMEYYLTMQIHHNRGEIASILVKGIPFLYEIFFLYAKKNITIDLDAICNRKGDMQYRISRKKLKNNQPNLLEYLDSQFPPKFKDGENLSVRNLRSISWYAKEENCVKDSKLHDAWLSVIDSMSDVINTRNSVAHIIVNIDEKKFKELCKKSPGEILNNFWKLLCLMYGEDSIKSQRGIYGSINDWIIQELETPYHVK